MAIPRIIRRPPEKTPEVQNTSGNTEVFWTERESLAFNLGLRVGKLAERKRLIAAVRNLFAGLHKAGAVSDDTLHMLESELEKAGL